MFRPNKKLPSTSNQHACRTKGVRILPKPQFVTVGLPPGFNKCCLNVVYHDGICRSYTISKKVAEVLSANGISTEG